MQQEAGQKKWKKQIKGNLIFADVKNPLRNFVQKELPSIKLENYPLRPQECVNLSIGDPTISLDFRTSKANLETFCKNVGKVDGYTNMQGIESSREALVDKYKVKSYNITKDDAYLTAGGSMAIWVTMNLLAGEGDNFLFPSPGFPLSLTIAKSMQLEPRIYHLEADNLWSASIKEMESLIDDRTKFILVNDPSNPLGSSWSAQHKEQILQLAKRRNIPLLVDEIYEGMLYGEQVPTFAELVSPEDSEHITIFKCSGLTKRYLGPGWRMGWILLYASKSKQQFYRPFLRGIFNVILMPNTVMQMSISEIINNPVNDEKMTNCMDLMRINQKTLKDALKDEEYCAFGHSSGALYATILLKLQKFDSNQIKTTIDFAKLLYAEQNIKIFPGDFFAGAVPFIRLVISCSTENIKNFLERFIRFSRNHVTKSK